MGQDAYRLEHSLRSLIAILLTFAISSLGTTIVFPIFAPLFLSGSESIPASMRSILLGLFLTAYPLAQFIFSPLIGVFADRRGRKITFLITLLMETAGYALAALAIQWQHLSLLFIGRFITGIAAGNMSICLATLVDLSPNEKTRVKYFSYGSAIAGVMFVLGPFAGGKLSDSTISPFFTLSLPMWVGMGISFINFLIMLFLYKETSQERVTRTISPRKAIHNVQATLKSRRIKDLYLIYFFFLFAWNMIYQFMPAIMVEKFASKSPIIGDVSALLGAIWIIGTICMRLLLLTPLPLKYVLQGSLVIFALSTLLIPIPKELFLFLLITGIAVFFAGGMWPIFINAISYSAEPSRQGKVMGLSQSIQSFSTLLAPLIGGFLLQMQAKAPFALSTLSALIAVVLLARIHNKLHH